MKKYLSRPSRLVVGLAAALAFLSPALDGQAGPTVWVVPAMKRVARDEPAGNQREITLWAARGEYESFQMVVRAPAGGLKNVNVAISDLAGEHGHIPKANLMLYREHYIQIKQGSPDRGGTNRPLGPGWYADALIPFTGDKYKGLSKRNYERCPSIFHSPATSPSGSIFSCRAMRRDGARPI